MGQVGMREIVCDYRYQLSNNSRCVLYRSYERRDLCYERYTKMYFFILSDKAENASGANMKSREIWQCRDPSSGNHGGVYFRRCHMGSRFGWREILEEGVDHNAQDLN